MLQLLKPMCSRTCVVHQEKPLWWASCVLQPRVHTDKERRNKGDNKLDFFKKKKHAHKAIHILENTYTQDVEAFGRVEIFTQIQVFWEDVSTLYHDGIKRPNTLTVTFGQTHTNKTTMTLKKKNTYNKSVCIQQNSRPRRGWGRKWDSGLHRRKRNKL